jgi:hypothetical protein
MSILQKLTSIERRILNHLTEDDDMCECCDPKEELNFTAPKHMNRTDVDNEVM